MAVSTSFFSGGKSEPFFLKHCSSSSSSFSYVTTHLSFDGRNKKSLVQSQKGSSSTIRCDASSSVDPLQQLKTSAADTSLLDRRGEASQSMGQRIKRFDFVSRDSPQVGFESRVMGDYPAQFGEHFLSALVNGSPSIKQERSGYSHGGVTIDSIYYYGKLVYQDVNLRSYFGSIRPPARLTFGFRLGRCILIHFPQRTFIHFFLPRRPRRLKRRDKSRPGKEKGRWWAFRKVRPIRCLYSSNKKEEERNEVRGRRAGKRVDSIRLDDREKQNEIRIWPKKKQRYGYHDRSPLIKKNISKSLRVSGAFKHPKYTGAVNDIEFLIENYDSFRKTKFLKFFFPKKSRSDGPTKSSTSEKKCLAEAKKRLTHLIRLATDLRFTGTTKTTISLFPFFGATFFFPRDRVGIYNNLFLGCPGTTPRSIKDQMLEPHGRIVKDIPLVMKKGVEGIRICCSGRSEGTKIARTECGKYGKHLVIYLTRKSIMLLRKYLLVTESQVSKCGFHIVKKRDVLYPKRTKFSKHHKGRCSRGCKPDGTKLGFGRYGTQSCRVGRLSYRATEAARRAIIGHFHRAMSGQFRKNGKIWVRVFADIPITGKPTEVRMGRGKGNLTSWIARVSAGQVLFEMDGVSLSNSRQAATLAAHKP
ncbi:hypothetical protein RYX36_006821, partial [Vicia faba]